MPKGKGARFARRLQRRWRTLLRSLLRGRKRVWRTARRGVSRRIKAARREYTFRRTMRRLIYELPPHTPIPEDLLSDLIYGWGNIGYSVGREYARAVLRHALSTDGPILECGSGLTTLLLGVTAQESGNEVWTLEHDPFWAGRVRKVLRRYRIDSVKLCETGLRDYDSYSWYAPPRTGCQTTSLWWFAIVHLERRGAVVTACCQ